MTVSPDRPAVAVDDLHAAEEAVREQGLRLTSARRLVLQALFAARGPVSAEEIASGLNGRLTASDLTSVYRNLETLEGVGIVRHFHAGHGPGRYVLEGDREREYLACEVCGRVEAVPPETLDPARKAIASATGYAVRFAHFPIVGRCDDCAVHSG
ncbi:MAG: transcriptional repressor [Solirubrobacterales bacterium]|nr:transcriptional repressor [Solirubrobacterales bacterium]